MKQFLLALLFVCLIVLPVAAQNALVQIIHNAADIDVRSVDVYANGDSLLGSFGFRTATPFIEIAAGTYDIVIAPDKSANATDSVITQFQLTVEAGKKYVAIVNGISKMNIDAGKYFNPAPETRNIELAAFAIPDAHDAAVDPAKVEFMVFHGSTDAPAVDVLTLGMPIVDNLDYGMSTSYLAVDPAKYQLDITPAEDNTTIVASFDADISGLAGKAAVVFASGFLDPTVNEGGKAFGLFAALPTGDVVEFPIIIILPPGPWKNLGVCSDWKFDAVFEDQLNQTHGVAVDKEGKIWMGSYGAVAPIVKHPDGTPASFCPLNNVTIAGEVIDLSTGNCRGMGVDLDGNILYCRGSMLIKINSQTGEGMAKWQHSTSLLAPSVDDQGFIYVGQVVGVNPVNVIDPTTFELTQQIELPGAPSYARGAVVTPDGKGIWPGDLGGDGGPLYKWTTEDFVTYTKTDSIYTNTDGEMIFTTQRTTLDWGPGGTMWVSHDNAYAEGDNSPNGLKVFDFTKMEYCFLPSPEVAEGKGNGPRGVAFSPSGDTAYVAGFNPSLVWRFVREAKSFVQIIHNAADIDVRSVDVYANGDSLLGSFGFRTATPFVEIAAGTYDIVIAPDKSANATDSVIAQFQLTVEAGKKHVVIVNGISEMNIAAGKYFNPAPETRSIELTAFVVPDAQDAAMNPEKVEFMAFHGSTDAPKVDIWAVGLPIPIVNDLDYGNNTAYLSVDPGQYQLDVTPFDDKTTILASFDVDISGLAGNAAVVFASGFVDPKVNEGGKSFGLFAALPTGDVVEFPIIIILPKGPWKNMGVCEKWEFDGVFEDQLNQTHGVAVDKEGKIWMGSYGAVAPIVKHPDGTPASFCPLNSVTIGGETIDLATGNCRGMGVDLDGNILYCRGSMLIKINSQTGEGMAKWQHSTSLLAPSVDDQGFIYVGQVVGVNPVNVIDPTTFELTQQIELPGAPSYARGAVVTPDGKGIWPGDLGGDGGPLYKWTTEDFVTYTKTDSIYTNTDGEMIFTTQRTTLDWGPGGTMWVSHDNAYAAGDNSPNGLKVFDFTTMEYCFLPSPEVAAGIGNGPRGVAFSPSGDTAYVACFNASVVWRFVRKGIGIEIDQITGIPTEYRLGQNYPNPFNPTTIIPFAIVNQGDVELKIYDILGREVKTLVNRSMSPGSYQVIFDGTDLASGTYIYRLSTNGVVLTKQMLLVK